MNVTNHGRAGELPVVKVTYLDLKDIVQPGLAIEWVGVHPFLLGLLAHKTQLLRPLDVVHIWLHFALVCITQNLAW